MITINLEYFDRETEVSITVAKTGLGREEAEKIVDFVDAVRNLARGKIRPTIRGSIMIGRVVKQNGIPIDPDNQTFREIFYDIMSMELLEGNMQARDVVHELFCKKGREVAKENEGNKENLKSKEYTRFGFNLEKNRKD
ncbi:MAG: hypothetical protein AB1796_05110 [Bacillota bacterium]